MTVLYEVTVWFLSPSKGRGEDTLDDDVDLIFKSKIFELILLGDKVGKEVVAVAVLLWEVEIEVVSVEIYFLLEQDDWKSSRSLEKDDVRTCGRGHEEEERRESDAEVEEVEEVVEAKIGYGTVEVEEEEEQEERGM